MKKLLFVAVLLAVAAGCGSNKTKTVATGTLVGADVDQHGCRPSAGYTWSEVRGDCIRIFEAGMRMLPEKMTNATLATYVVFNADSTRVEVFWGEGGRRSVLDRTAVKPMATWRNSSLDMLMNNPAKGFVLMNSADGTTWLQSKK